MLFKERNQTMMMLQRYCFQVFNLKVGTFLPSAFNSSADFYTRKRGNLSIGINFRGAFFVRRKYFIDVQNGVSLCRSKKTVQILCVALNAVEKIFIKTSIQKMNLCFRGRNRGHLQQ
jgi:hypothetical protein